MKKFGDLIRPKASRSATADSNPGADTPEANVARAIIAFCEAGKGKSQAPGPEGIDPSNQVDEVTFLPIIVESAESTPTAAKEALYTIRKQLDYKNHKKAYQQYNALMLLRILVDNPGASFTKHIDSKFVSTVKELYRGSRDPSVQQLLRENLDYFEKKEDPGLQPVKEWYNKERESSLRSYMNIPPLPRTPMGMYAGPTANQQPYSGSRSHRRPKGTLPPPEELAARVAEAQTSAKLLMQILQSTPLSEILGNPLITEFADRCSAASRSIQAFIEADSPPPDESTMLTLFETNEQLATSLSKHQQAVFSAKQELKREGGGSRMNSSDQVPQIPPAPEPVMSAPTRGSPGPIPEPVSETRNTYGFSGFRRSPEPPAPKPYEPSPVQPTTDNPFNDSEPNTHTTPYQAWRPQPYEAQPQQQHEPMRYDPSPLDQNQNQNQGQQERHPMADVSPVGAPMPHGYQPYRY